MQKSGHACRRWHMRSSIHAQAAGTYSYCISRTGSMSALGVAPPRKALYLLVCSACGQRFERYRASALVKYPERYRCTCGGKLKQISRS